MSAVFSVAAAMALLATTAPAGMAQAQAPRPAASSVTGTPGQPASATVSSAAASGGSAYRSAFEGYRRHGDQPLGSWREANELVGRIGGWQAYAREGQAEGQPDSSAGKPSSMPAGHGGMNMQPSAGALAPGSPAASSHNMGSMKDMPGKAMPGMDSKPADAPKGKEGAAGHNMASMKDMPGKAMHGMASNAGGAPKGKEGAAGHNMASMKGMPGKTMPGVDSKATDAPKGKDGAAGHDMGSMKDMPGKAMPGMSKQADSESMSKEGHGAMAMAKPQTAPNQPGSARTASVTGTGVVRGIDKANGKVRLTHDPIAALGWPRMTVLFRLKNSLLAGQLKEGDMVEFSLEKSTSGYIISSLQKGPASHDMKQKK